MPNEPGFNTVIGRGAMSRAELRRRVKQRKHLTRVRPIELSEEMFARLWSDLEAVGLFELTESPGSTPPGGNRPYFLLSDGRRQWIFARPDDRRPENLSAEERKKVAAWRRAKQIISSR